MNDELPFAIGYSPSFTHMVIAGPYAGAEESSHAIARVGMWAGLAAAMLVVLLAVLWIGS